MNIMQCRKKRGQDYKSGFEDGVRQGVKESIKYILMAVVQYLGDKRGWKREQIFRAILWLQKHAVMILEDYTTFPEVVEAVKEEYGILYEDNNFIFLSEDEWKGDSVC